MTNPISTPDELDPEAGFTANPSVTQAASDLRAATSDKAKKIIHSAEAKASQLRDAANEKASHLRESATEQWDCTRVKAKELHCTAEDYVRANPTKCVVGALGFGFLVGLIMRR